MNAVNWSKDKLPDQQVGTQPSSKVVHELHPEEKIVKYSPCIVTYIGGKHNMDMRVESLGLHRLSPPSVVGVSRK